MTFKYILELSKENLEFSKKEALAVLKPLKFKLSSNLLFLNKIKGTERLAYTKKAYQLLGTNLNKIQWAKHYKTSFKVIAKNMNEKTIAEKIWNKLKTQKQSAPKVNLTNPKTNFVVLNKKYYTKLIYQNQENFNSRKTQNRPEPHPSSLHPKLARAMVNLTGARNGSIILDPFCGSGGILIEAGLLNMKPIGFDIDQVQINRSKINLKHFKVKAKLELQDATTITKLYKYIVTDLPYGKNTKSQDIHKLLQEFLSNAKSKIIVLGLPDFAKGKTIIKKSKFKITQEFKFYLHKSLSKEIFVIEKKNNKIIKNQ